jgi:hypothetical protein
MVRNIDVAREKDSISLKPFTSESAFRKWIYAVGECGLALCAGVPVMQSFYKSYMRNGLPSKMGNDPALATGMSFLRGQLKCEELPVTPEARAQVFDIWGMTPDEQVALEDLYDTAKFQWTNEVSASLMTIRTSPL